MSYLQIIWRSPEMADTRGELLQGTLEMLVLKTLALEPMHGWGIAHRIEAMSGCGLLGA